MKVVVPTVKDVKAICGLINIYSLDGILLMRSYEEILKNINNFRVVKLNRSVVGCVAIHIYSETLAELRTLIIHPKNHKQGIGRVLVENIKQLSADLKIRKLFTLTQQPDFFKRCGFEYIDKSTLPEKIFKDCTHCKYFNDCRETALQVVFEVQ